METVEATTGQPSAADIAELPQDAILEVLSNQRRRFTVQYLKQHSGEPATVSELAEQVASWENGKLIDELTHQERKRVRNALRQFHLPKMADYGFVEYDVDRGTVCLTAATANTNFYIDALTGREIPWGVYYLGCSVACAIWLVGLWVGLYPFTVLSPLTYSTFVVAFFVCSSVGHVYDNQYRMRLGARTEPLEVNAE